MGADIIKAKGGDKQVRQEQAAIFLAAGRLVLSPLLFFILFPRGVVESDLAS